MKPFIKFISLVLILPAIIMTLNSCTKKEEEETFADLTVIVKNSAGIEQQGVIVGIYPSQNDANNATNLLKNSQNTDASGVAKFAELDKDKAYWVRAANTTGFTVKETIKLSSGANTFQTTI